jgi:hypothetical protein
MSIAEIYEKLKWIEFKIQQARREKAPNLTELLEIKAKLECRAFEFDM